MKNFILGIITCALLSFTSIETGIITVKPALPKSVFTICCYSVQAPDYIKQYTKLGYKYHSFSGAGNSSYGVLVMEKY